MLTAAVLLAATLPAADPNRPPVRPDDIYRLDTPTQAVLTPDGSRAVYVRNWVDPTTHRERFSLWANDGTGHRPLEPGEPDARRPVISPDGRWAVVASTRPRPNGWPNPAPVPAYSDPASDLWLVPLAGGPAVPLAGADKPYGRALHDGFYGNWQFSPDGRSLAFVADVPAPVPGPDAPKLVRDDQGEGYTGYGPAQVWVARLAAAPNGTAAERIERLTDDSVWYGDPRWTPGGRSLVVHANKTNDRESARFSINKDFDLYRIDIASRQQTRLTSGPGPEVFPRVSPDGKRIACLSVPRKGTHNDTANLAVVTLGESGPSTRVLFDHHGPQSGTPPHPPTHPTSADPLWGWDRNDHLVYTAPVGTGNKPTRVEVATGKGEPFAPPPRLNELLPKANPFLAERSQGEAKVVTWEHEGRKLEGLLILPPAGVAKAPYKLALWPHGGPHSRTAVSADIGAQVLAGAGYAVFQPNFRGSAGYGQAFIDADRHDFGGGDVRDILAGIDALVRDGVIDRDRQFVTGTSYGGFLTCALVTQTRQFRAAVPINAVTDLTMFWGLSDIPSWIEWEFGGRPWEVPAALRAHSPLTFAATVRTPTLVLHSRDDRRVPLPLGIAFHRAVRATGTPSELVIYPDEGHGIRQPEHRVDVLKRVLAWFETHGGR
jgi:dipeptidyl aminopeptidase/acylaminoacyl peptidase